MHNKLPSFLRYLNFLKIDGCSQWTPNLEAMEVRNKNTTTFYNAIPGENLQPV